MKYVQSPIRKAVLVFMVFPFFGLSWCAPLPKQVTKKELVEADHFAELLATGQYSAYITALNQKLETLPATSCRARAHIYHELAEVYTKRLLNQEKAGDYIQRLEQLLDNCEFGDKVDGYSNLPEYLKASKGQPYQVSHKRYLERYRNLSKVDLRAANHSRKQFIAMRLGENGRLVGVTNRIEPDQAEKDLSALQKNSFAPGSLRARAAAELANRFASRGEWSMAGQVANYAFQADKGSQFTYLDELERIQCIYIIYRTLYEQNHFESAMTALERCISLLERVRDRYTTENARALFFRQIEWLIDERLDLQLERRELKDALVSLEERKNRTLKELIERRRLLTESAEADIPAANDRAAPGLSEFRMTLAEAENEEKVEQLDLTPIPKERGLTILHDRTGVTGREMGLLPKELALVFFRDPDKERITLFAFTQEQRLAVLNYHLPEKNLVEVREQWMAINGNKGPVNVSTELVRQALAYLHELILGPFIRSLDKLGLNGLEDYRLVIVPFGVLHEFPFHAFYNETTNKYLFQNVAGMVYCPSYELFVTSRTKTLKRPFQALSVGVSKFKNHSYLENAKDEAEKVAEYFKNPVTLVNEAAVKDRILKEVKRTNIIHFATHANFNAEDPTASPIVLFHDDKPSGYLLAHEFAGMDLSDKLFTLSACKTGLQSVQAGDDLFGIDRYLLAGGAVGIVSSLWPVRDSVARPFMLAFYQRINAGDSPSTAWFESMKQIMAFDKRPLSWAPFKVTAFH